MSGSCMSSNPPELIFTSWPVATTACLQQLERQDDGRERDKKKQQTGTPLKKYGVKTAIGWPAVCCTDFELLTFPWGLETVCGHFLASVGFWIPQNSKTVRGICDDKSQASVAVGLYYSSFFLLLTSVAWLTVKKLTDLVYNLLT